MKFYLEEMILWLKTGEKRTLKFANNKVNVITGKSKTGKTAVLEILDYCFCGSETVNITYEHIGENVSWYGVKFSINDKTFTIARGEITNNGKLSNDYFFSQTGQIPELPSVKMKKEEIKEILMKEFSLVEDIALAYGGRQTKKNTLLSFRYFLIFNTLSKDIVDNGKVFFDKLHITRYKDVWPQIFDLAFDVINFEIVKEKKKIADLENEINQLEKEKKKIDSEKLSQSRAISLLVKFAKEAELIDFNLSEDDAYVEITKLIEENKNGVKQLKDIPNNKKYEKLENKIKELSMKILKMERFKNSYGKYKEIVKKEEDALKPVEYIKNAFSDGISGEYKCFIDALAKELQQIREYTSKKRPFEYDVEKTIKELKKKKAELEQELQITPYVSQEYKLMESKLVSYGRLCEKYSQIEKFDESKEKALEGLILEKSEEVAKLKSNYETVGERRTFKLQDLDECIQKYIEIAGDELDEYRDYRAHFDYKQAVLRLRAKGSPIYSNISSSSDHLFMHLCLFAGIHEMLVSQKSLLIPGFLIIDQPSRPYFNDEEKDGIVASRDSLSNKADWSKVLGIFNLLNEFMNNILRKNKEFQIVVLEHVGESAWEKYDNIHLVEVFDGDNNALIPLNCKGNVKLLE